MESRFIQSYNGESRFLGYRGYRMNYYAVTAELARVYLYAQKADEAYAEAKKSNRCGGVKEMVCCFYQFFWF